MEDITKEIILLLKNINTQLNIMNEKINDIEKVKIKEENCLENIQETLDKILKNTY